MKHTISSTIAIATGISLFGIINIAQGQQSNTVYQSLGTNITVKPYTSAVVRSIGQINHLAIATFVDNTPNTCISPSSATTLNVGLLIQGSFDNVHYFNIPQKLQVITGSDGVTNFIGYVFGSGSFPYIKEVVTDFDNTNCKISLLAYSGNITPDNDFFPGISKLGMTYSALGNTSASIRDIVICPSVSGLRTSLYGATISTDTAQTIRLATYDPGNLTATIIYQFYLAANSNIVLPIGDNAYGLSVYNGSILIDATGTTGNISASAQCRNE